MKFYLASSFKNKVKVEQVAYYLTKRGHTITTQWWHTDFKKTVSGNDAEWYADERVQAISKRNFKGIEDAEVLILVARKEPVKYNGANIELGYALALGKPCYSLGYLERSAMYCPVIKCKAIDELLVKIATNANQRFKCGRCGAHVRFVDLRLLGCTKCGGDNGSSDYGVLEAKYGRGQKRLNGVIQ